MNPRIERVRCLPLHRHLGVEKIAAHEGSSRFSVPVEGAVLNPANVLHGGVIYTLCDVAAYTALLSLLPDDREAVTHDIHVAVLRPAVRGETVTFCGNVIRQGKALAFLEATAMVGDRLIARAAVTKSLMQLKDNT